MTYLTFLFLRLGHKGALVFGTIGDKGGGHARPFSFYEGIPWSDFSSKSMKYLELLSWSFLLEELIRL
jgi:hypothetical protein